MNPHELVMRKNRAIKIFDDKIREVLKNQDSFKKGDELYGSGEDQIYSTTALFSVGEQVRLNTNGVKICEGAIEGQIFTISGWESDGGFYKVKESKYVFSADEIDPIAGHEIVHISIAKPLPKDFHEALKAVANN